MGRVDQLPCRQVYLQPVVLNCLGNQLEVQFLPWILDLDLILASLNSSSTLKEFISWNSNWPGVLAAGKVPNFLKIMSAVLSATLLKHFFSELSSYYESNCLRISTLLGTWLLYLLQNDSSSNLWFPERSRWLFVASKVTFSQVDPVPIPH